MVKELYVVYFESAIYCGYGEHVLVWATDVEDARDAAEGYASDFYCDQDQDQYMDGVAWASIMSVELLAGSEYEEFANSYEVINTKD
jgi:hypothetical protein